MIRDILQIDEAKCDGCGQCIPSCAEGALYLEGGKVRMRSEMLCDGLGACLGDCPQGALTVVRREAASFDEVAVEAAAAALRLESQKHAAPRRMPLVPVNEAAGCPGSRPRPAGAGPAPLAPPRARLSIVSEAPAPPPPVRSQGGSKLAHWPVQLALVPASAPWLRGADLLLAADCAPFAYANFHADFLAGRELLVGCPKLDDLASYAEKLTALFREAQPRSVTVVKMEVPCCNGIATAARQALRASGSAAPIEVATLAISGGVRDRA